MYLGKKYKNGKRMKIENREKLLFDKKNNWRINMQKSNGCHDLELESMLRDHQQQKLIATGRFELPFLRRINQKLIGAYHYEWWYSQRDSNPLPQ